MSITGTTYAKIDKNRQKIEIRSIKVPAITRFGGQKFLGKSLKIVNYQGSMVNDRPKRRLNSFVVTAVKKIMKMAEINQKFDNFRNMTSKKI